MFEDFGINAGFVEDLHAQYRQSRQSVDDQWRAFFDAFERGDSAEAPGTGNGHAEREPRPYLGLGGPGGNAYANGTPRDGVRAQALSPFAAPAMPRLPPATNGARDERLLAAAAVQGRVYQLVNAYRVRGHLFAKIDPLGTPPEAAPELELSNFGLTADYDVTFPTVGMSGIAEKATLREIISHLEETYCGSIGVESPHIEEPEAREWLQNAMESTRNRTPLDPGETLRVLTRLTDAEIFEQFVHTNFLGAKRFSAEGAESMIAMLDLLIDYAAGHGIEEIVIGMAHRGRLNVLANVMGKNVREIFAAAFRDSNPERNLGRGDVKYHLGASADRVTSTGRKIHLSLAFNPSHLEFVNPVVEGRVRAKQDRQKRLGVMPLLIHGDAAFMGQGVISETLNMAGLEGYSTGGTVHLVVNNQIGFTTLPQDSRSTRYCTDITRMLKVPVFHVNGEDPEAVIQVTRLAIEFRQRFGKDVVIDMLCYRRFGHNEADEPRYTQPMMYHLIDQKPTVRQVYVNKLARAGQITPDLGNTLMTERKAALEQALVEEKQGDWLRAPSAMEGIWTPYYGGPDARVEEVDTRVSEEKLNALATRLAELPQGFHANPKIKGMIDLRRDRVAKSEPFDWGTAEHLAFASLASEGRRIRLSGQDSRRGTFAHRHATLYDAKTGQRFTPLAKLGEESGGKFEVFDSPLSEQGVLAFDYGYSLDCPEGLVIWEAQFGDFVNGAQVIIDQFIVSAEDKWLRLSGLVMLLPHGYEGQGPEHSSARIERFLQLSASDNIQVCNLTTPAQLFHVLRRQVLRPWRKPLVIFTPKSLLRHKEAVSTTADLAHGAFQRVIPDTESDPRKVKRVLLCTGKVYYDLLNARRELKRDDVAIVRLEQLYPVGPELVKALGVYADGTRLVWVQEEPRNMGPWYFLNANLRSIIGERLPLSVVARAAAASPATGSSASHKLEQQRLIGEALAE